MKGRGGARQQPQAATTGKIIENYSQLECTFLKNAKAGKNRKKRPSFVLRHSSLLSSFPSRGLSPNSVFQRPSSSYQISLLLAISSGGKRKCSYMVYFFYFSPFFSSFPPAIPPSTSSPIFSPSLPFFPSPFPPEAVFGVPSPPSFPHNPPFFHRGEECRLNLFSPPSETGPGRRSYVRTLALRIYLHVPRRCLILYRVERSTNHIRKTRSCSLKSRSEIHFFPARTLRQGSGRPRLDPSLPPSPLAITLAVDEQ